MDAICDGDDVVIGGIMQHIEQAGVHSGDLRVRCRLIIYRLRFKMYSGAGQSAGFGAERNWLDERANGGAR